MASLNRRVVIGHPNASNMVDVAFALGVYVTCTVTETPPATGCFAVEDQWPWVLSVVTTTDIVRVRFAKRAHAFAVRDSVSEAAAALISTQPQMQMQPQSMPR
jgi:hypothetical protein